MRAVFHVKHSRRDLRRMEGASEMRTQMRGADERMRMRGRADAEADAQARGCRCGGVGAQMQT